MSAAIAERTLDSEEGEAEGGEAAEEGCEAEAEGLVSYTSAISVYLVYL